jgi:hypothetical protein
MAPPPIIDFENDFKNPASEDIVYVPCAFHVYQALVLGNFTRTHGQVFAFIESINVQYSSSASNLRPVSTQENKHQTGSDSFPSFIIHAAKQKNVKILQLFIVGSRCRKLLTINSFACSILFLSAPMPCLLSRVETGPQIAFCNPRLTS